MKGLFQKHRSVISSHPNGFDQDVVRRVCRYLENKQGFEQVCINRDGSSLCVTLLPPENFTMADMADSYLEAKQVVEDGLDVPYSNAVKY